VQEPYLLRSFKVITIRHSVKAFLETNHGIESKFIPHPFFPYEKLGEGLGYEFVSISRIDFDKNIHIILQANQLQADQSKCVRLFGAPNRLYIHHKLGGLGFEDCYEGRFPKDIMEPSHEGKSILQVARCVFLLILKPTALHIKPAALDIEPAARRYVVDLSTIKNDGGGTQYTFLEAIYGDCVLVLHEGWVSQGSTFVSGVSAPSMCVFLCQYYTE
jgi:hypothetical protein